MALISTLFDDFNDGVRNASLWYNFQTGSATITEANGVLTINHPAGTDSNAYAGYGSQATYDMTDNGVVVEVVNATRNASAETYLIIYNSSGNFMISQYGTSLRFGAVWGGGGSESNTTITFSATSHRWWRIRHQSGVIYWDTSADGLTWTNRKSLVHNFAFAINSVGVEIAAGVYGTVSSPVTATFDNFNSNQSAYRVVGSVSGGGLATLNSETATITVTSTISGGGIARYLTAFQPLPQKDYEYRVFDEDWNYIATWQGIVSEFSFPQRLNENAGDMQITLARSPDNRVVRLDALKDNLGATITDENGDTILVQTETANSVGPDTDVRENLNVEIYAFYGGYEPLTDEDGEEILDTAGDVIISQYGAPNGKRVYSGYIADFELVYGENTAVNVVLVPHATSMSHYVFYNGTSTTINYLNTDPVKMARDAMNNYSAQGGYITYTSETMPLSGELVDYDFKLQRTREVIDKTVDLLPADYYHFVDPGENLQYLKKLGTTANHTFYYEKHITELRLRKSITRLINDVHFTGGEISPGVDLYVHRQDTASKSSIRPGLEIISDSRVTQIDSAQILSDRQIEEFKAARWRTTVEITDAVYDIELIKLGHIVDFANFGTIADELMLPVVGMEKKKHSVILELDMAIPSEAKRLEELKKQILNEQVRNIGAIPA